MNDSEERNGVKTLGTFTPFYVGITLNYSPKYIFTVGKKKLAWGRLTPDQQKEIFEAHLASVYKRHFSKLEFTFEFTKAGILHCHALGQLFENNDHKEYHLQMIRKLVGQHADVVRYTKGKAHEIISSNYIHLVDEGTWRAYMMKASNKVPYKYRTILNYL